MAETSTLTITRPPSSIIKNAPALRARDQAIRDGAPKTKELRDWILKFRALKTPASLSSRRTVSWIRPRLEEAKNDSGHLSEPNKPHPPTVPTITTINDTAVKDGIDLQKTHNSQDSGVHVNDDTRASSHSTGTTGASTRASSSSACEQSVPETARALDPLLEVAEAQPPSTSSKAKGKEVFAGIRSAGDVDSNIPVSVPMTRLQRLATLNLVSQKDLIARPIPVGNAEISKLRAFSAFLSPIKDQITLFGKELPRCRHHLVDFEPQHESSGASKAYICIEGLTNTADIKLFHKVMSQTRYRYLYEPWGLCYEAMKISRLAADHHVLQLQGNGDTYCGAVLEPSTGSEKFSTIGGLVEVDGNIYAMTTSHLPDKYQPVVEEKLKSLLENQADNLAESDFPENVEPAWVLTFDQDDYSAFSEISTETREGFFLDRAPEEISEYRERSFPNNRSLAVIEGDDWKLMPMDHRRQLPNIFFPSHGDKKYIINVCESPSGCAVAVVAGVTRPQSGTMSLGPSFLVGDGIVQEIWTTYMSKSGPGLRLGDSGSWVLDVEDPNDPKVVGQIIGRSQGRAHVSLLTRDFANISAALPKPGRVGLPSPLLALLDHSNYLKRSNFSREQYPIAEALSVEFLSRFPGDPFATALSDIVKEFSGSTSVQDLRSFSELLSECGRSIFDDPCPPLLELSSQFIRLRELYRRYKNSPAFNHGKSGPSNPEDGSSRDPNEPGSVGMGNPLSNSAIIHMPHMPETMEATQELGRIHNSILKVFPFKVDRRPNGKPFWHHVVLAVYIIISTVLGGVLAAYAWESIYADPDGPITISIGAVAGAISGAPMSLEVLFNYLVRQYKVVLQDPRRLLGRITRTLLYIAVGIPLFVLVVFGRPILLAYYLEGHANISNTKPSAASSVAAFPLFVSSYYIISIRGGWTRWTFPVGASEFSTVLLLLLPIIGFDLVAAVTYVAVCHRFDQDVLGYVPAVVTTIIFDSVAIFWPISVLFFTSPMITLLLLRRRKMFRSGPLPPQPSADGMNEERILSWIRGPLEKENLKVQAAPSIQGAPLLRPLSPGPSSFGDSSIGPPSSQTPSTWSRGGYAYSPSPMGMPSTGSSPAYHTGGGTPEAYDVQLRTPYLSLGSTHQPPQPYPPTAYIPSLLEQPGLKVVALESPAQRPTRLAPVSELE